MRIDVEKCLFIGCSSDKEVFIKSCFDLGVVQFISDRAVPDFSEDIKRGLKALKVLKRNFEEKEPSRSFDEAYVLFSDGQPFVVNRIIDETLTLDERRHCLLEELKTLDNEILRLEPLGDFVSSDLKDLETMTDMRIRFFYRVSREDDCLDDFDCLFYLSYSKGFNYYIAFGEHDLASEGFIELEAPFSSHELYEKSLFLKKELSEISSRLLELAGFHRMIAASLCDDYNEKSLKDALEIGRDEFDSLVFSMIGWIPKNQVQEIFIIAESLGICAERVAVDPDENPPVYLENRGVGRIGEDLMLIYDTPDSKDIDPSSWVFFSFVVFFSMIVNDAGYGLVFLSIALLMAFKKKKRKPSLSRFLRLSYFLGIGCIVWGVLTTSFFGISFSSSSVVRNVSIIHKLAYRKAAYFIKYKPPAYKEIIRDLPMMVNVTDPKVFLTMKQSREGSTEIKEIVYNLFLDNVLMELSLFVGALHVIFGIVRYRRFNPGALGWAIFVIGGYLYFPVYLRVVSLVNYLFGIPFDLGGQIGLLMMGLGIAWSCVWAVVKNKIKGLGEITQVIQVFSDILSYLRIYALGLAGAMMGATFNKIGAHMPPLLGILVITVGHCINIILSIMGGVIHGLRLNFIEWYHYSFNGGGNIFRPLAKLNPPD